MIHPLQKQKFKQGYKHGDKTYYSNQHLGVDWICDSGMAVYAPEDGEVTPIIKAQGGKTIHLVSKNREHRFMHLSIFSASGKVQSGDIIGYTGNTGLSTAPHLHWDIWDRKNGALKPSNFAGFVDPLSFELTLIPEEDMTDKEIYVMLEAMAVSFSRDPKIASPDRGVFVDINHYVTRYKQAIQKASVVDELIKNIEDIFVKQGLRFNDARDKNWRTKADVCGG